MLWHFLQIHQVILCLSPAASARPISPGCGCSGALPSSVWVYCGPQCEWGEPDVPHVGFPGWKRRTREWEWEGGYHSWSLLVFMCFLSSNQGIEFAEGREAHLTMEMGVFGPQGVRETRQNICEELNGVAVGRMGPRILYMVRDRLIPTPLCNSLVPRHLPIFLQGRSLGIRGYTLYVVRSSHLVSTPPLEMAIPPL